MALFSICILDVADEVACLKVARRYSTESVAALRKRIGTHEPILTFSTDDYPLDLDMIEGRRQKHSIVLRAVEELTFVNCSLQLLYQPSPEEKPESISEGMMKNLFESELGYFQQEHD